MAYFISAQDVEGRHDRGQHDFFVDDAGKVHWISQKGFMAGVNLPTRQATLSDVERMGGWVGRSAIATAEQLRGMAPGAVGPTQAELAEQQAGREEDYLARFRETLAAQEKIPTMAGRLGAELGLPGLRETAYGLQAGLTAVPEQERLISQQIGISAPRLERRIAQRQAEIAPSALRAAEAQQFAERELGERLGYGLAEQERELMPFETEAEMISDRAARELSMWTTEREGELDTLLKRMEIEGQLRTDEMTRAHELAMQENTFMNLKEQLGLEYGYEAWEIPYKKREYEYELGRPYYKPEAAAKTPLEELWPTT